MEGLYRMTRMQGERIDFVNPFFQFIAYHPDSMFVLLGVI